MKQNAFHLQTKDSYVPIQSMLIGQIGISKNNKLIMKLYNNEFAVLAGAADACAGDIYGTQAEIMVRIIQPGSVVAITVG